MSLLDVAKKALSQLVTAEENGPEHPSGKEQTYAINAVNAESIGTVINGKWYAPGYEGLTTPFDELPKQPTPCRYPGHRRRWRSIYGMLLCGTCQPPADKKLVAGWFEEPAPVTAERLLVNLEPPAAG
jgi:hypothetical protein